ncbi:hypothetical protein BP5796_01979 [Coleophoma crateriformis]|uniref:Uncharacterized protein n=1 Tax=Coleophoma crateriformis TaxID=565419 RepID=A0A3D8T1Z1_9HELO|nr:hypothetical protein BP5796_01979 [Coleophoma crateriformis]
MSVLPKRLVVLPVARNAFTDHVSTPANSTITNKTMIKIHADVRQSRVSFNLRTPSGEIAVPTIIKDGSPGTSCTIDVKKRVPVNDNLQPMFSNFEYLSPADPILDDGNFKKLGFDESNAQVWVSFLHFLSAGARRIKLTVYSHLPKLLSYLMLMAARYANSISNLAFDIAQFVSSQVTAGIPKAVDYNAQAAAILTASVVSDQETRARCVPPNFKSQEANVANVRTMASVALDASVDAGDTYAFLVDLTKSRYDSALEALTVAQDNFGKLQKELLQKQKDFSDSIKAWEKTMMIFAAVEDLVAIVAIAGSIAIAVFFSPDMAGDAAGVRAAPVEARAAVEVGAEVAENVTLVVKIINNMKELWKKMEPGLKKIYMLIKSIQTILQTMEKV